MFRPFQSPFREFDFAERLAAFAETCRLSSPGLEADLLREGYALFVEAAEELAGQSELPRRRAVEAMIAAGAHDGAALALIGHDRPFVLSRGGAGLCLATLVVERTGEEVSAEGPSPALAMLAAASLAWSEDLCAPPSARRGHFFSAFAKVH